MALNNFLQAGGSKNDNYRKGTECNFLYHTSSAVGEVCI